MVGVDCLSVVFVVVLFVGRLLFVVYFMLRVVCVLFVVCLLHVLLFTV